MYSNLQQSVRCPNCGSQAKRTYFQSESDCTNSCPNNQYIQTECSVCDYLMVLCSGNGNVVEAHAPGIASLPNWRNLQEVLSIPETRECPTIRQPQAIR